MSRSDNLFDATTILSAKMHDDAESEKYHFGENIPLFDVRKGSQRAYETFINK